MSERLCAIAISVMLLSYSVINWLSHTHTHIPHIPHTHTHTHTHTYTRAFNYRRAQQAESEVEALRKENERMQKQVQHARLGSMGKSIAPLYMQYVYMTD